MTTRDVDEGTVAFDRRRWLLRVLPGVLLSLGCEQRQTSCDHTLGLSPFDVELRRTLGYVDRSPVANATCANCRQFEAPSQAGTCGGCKVMAGPASPAGYCKVYASDA